MEAKQVPTIGRANTVFGSLKSWASSPFNSGSNSAQRSSTKPSTSTSCLEISSSCASSTAKAKKAGYPIVAVHKLRESRWFGSDEWRLFCTVVETGFVVEIKEEGQENEVSTFGVVQFKCRKGKHIFCCFFFVFFISSFFFSFSNLVVKQ